MRHLDMGVAWAQMTEGQRENKLRYQKEYREKNRIAIRTYQRNWAKRQIRTEEVKRKHRENEARRYNTPDNAVLRQKMREVSKRWYEENKDKPGMREKRRERTRRYYLSEKGRTTRRRNQLKRRNWTLEHYNEVLLAQNGLCAVLGCGLPATEADHNHTTGMPRGILCHYCNLALGLTKERPEVLSGLAAYIIGYQK